MNLVPGRVSAKHFDIGKLDEKDCITGINKGIV